MPFQPAFVGFLVKRAKVLVRADLLGVLGADRRVAGSALPLLHFPVALEVTDSSAGAVSFSASHPADDRNPAVGEFNALAHLL